MGNLADYIENHLKALLDQSGGMLEVQRCELAEQFGCAPSQINYVLATRFNPQRGYVVESRRGGGGFIRIIRLNIQEDLQALINERIGEHCSQDEAMGLIQRLHEEGVLSEREALLMRSVIQRESIPLDLPLRDLVRASLLKAMVLTILRF